MSARKFHSTSQSYDGGTARTASTRKPQRRNPGVGAMPDVRLRRELPGPGERYTDLHYDEHGRKRAK